MTRGELIKQLRTQRKWTQAELGKAVGVSWQNISAMERGKHGTDKNIIAIAKAFGLSVELFDQMADLLPPGGEVYFDSDAIHQLTPEARTALNTFLKLITKK